MSLTHAGPSVKANTPITDSQLSSNIPRLDAVSSVFLGDLHSTRVYGDGSNLTGLTPTQVGLGNVPNINFMTAMTWQNVIHVGKNGTDTRTGVNKYSAFTPFLTLTAAQAAAVSGDTVWIHAGIITDNRVLLKSNVNWHFDNGAFWNATSSNDYDVMMGDYNFDTATATTVTGVTISGNGVFTYTEAGHPGRVLQLVGTGSHVVAYGTFNDIGVYNSGGQAVISGGVGSYLEVHGDVIGAYVGAGASSTGTLIVNGNVYGNGFGVLNLDSSNVTINGNAMALEAHNGYCAAQGNGANLTVTGTITNAGELAAAYGSGNMTCLGDIFSGGGLAGVEIFGTPGCSFTAKNIKITGDYAVVFGTDAADHIDLRGCELISTGASNPSISIGGQVSHVLRAYNCVFRPGASQANAITANSPVNVRVAQSRSTKTIAGANVTNLIASSLNVVDTNV